MIKSQVALINKIFKMVNEENREQVKRLSELKTGRSAIIMSFDTNDIFLKLMEMGCIPGEVVKINQVAPLGDPIAISVSGYHLSLRLDEARNIFVKEIAEIVN